MGSSLTPYFCLQFYPQVPRSYISVGSGADGISEYSTNFESTYLQAPWSYQKVSPEMNVSRRVDYRSTQDHYLTPSDEKVTAIQRRQQNRKNH